LKDFNRPAEIGSRSGCVGVAMFLYGDVFMQIPNAKEGKVNMHNQSI